MRLSGVEGLPPAKCHMQTFLQKCSLPRVEQADQCFTRAFQRKKDFRKLNGFHEFSTLPYIYIYIYSAEIYIYISQQNASRIIIKVVL